jgi:hypothetical protein
MDVLGETDLEVWAGPWSRPVVEAVTPTRRSQPVSQESTPSPQRRSDVARGEGGRVLRPRLRVAAARVEWADLLTLRASPSETTKVRDVLAKGRKNSESEASRCAVAAQGGPHGTSSLGS